MYCHEILVDLLIGDFTLAEISFSEIKVYSHATVLYIFIGF